MTKPSIGLQMCGLRSWLSSLSEMLFSMFSFTRFAPVALKGTFKRTRQRLRSHHGNTYFQEYFLSVSDVYLFSVCSDFLSLVWNTNSVWSTFSFQSWDRARLYNVSFIMFVGKVAFTRRNNRNVQNSGSATVQTLFTTVTYVRLSSLVQLHDAFYLISLFWITQEFEWNRVCVAGSAFLQCWRVESFMLQHKVKSPQIQLR